MEQVLTYCLDNSADRDVWDMADQGMILHHQQPPLLGPYPGPEVLIVNAPIATKVVCFSRLLKCLRSLYGKHCGPRSDCSAVCSGSTLFASILNSSVMLGNYLQQTTSADDIFRCIFFLAL